MKTQARHKVQCIKEAKITIPKCFNLELVKPFTNFKKK